MSVVVTGASGHLGNILVRDLAARGVQVRALFRSPPPYVVPDGVTAMSAAVQDLESLRNACAGADAVYHTAGLISIGIGTKKKLHDVNVQGTRNVIQACVEEGVGRLIYISSIEAYDLSSCEYPVVESNPVDPDHSIMPYGRTKALATLEVEDAVRSSGLDAVIIIPTGFIGPFDYKMTPMTSMVRDFAAGKIPASVAGGFDFVDARDVASAAVLAAERGKTGERYLVSGRYAAVAEILKLLEKATGRRAPRFTIPAGVGRIWGFVGEILCAVLGKQPRYTQKSLKILSLGVTVSSEKIRKELGYEPRPLEQSLSETVDWLAARQGKLRE